MGVLTWDDTARIYRMWWFDDSGTVGEYRGAFRDENTLVLEYQGKQDGQDFRERLSYSRLGPGQLSTKIEQAQGSSDFAPYLEATARRMHAGAARSGPAPQLPPQQ
jgi:hypothetical protein